VHHKIGLGLITTITVGATVLVVLALSASNPGRLGPLGITLWFVALLVALSGITAILLYVAKSQLRREDTAASRLSSSLRQGLLLGGGVTICLGLESLRQLGVRDVILIVILAGLIEFYFRTRQ